MDERYVYADPVKERLHAVDTSRGRTLPRVKIVRGPVGVGQDVPRVAPPGHPPPLWPPLTHEILRRLNRWLPGRIGRG